jgi:predicted RNase H-like nuclease (RuvC/YqgF family)
VKRSIIAEKELDAQRKDEEIRSLRVELNESQQKWKELEASLMLPPQVQLVLQILR